MEGVMAAKTFHEMSDNELDRIESLVEAATIGPWFSLVVGRDREASVNCIELGSCNELGSFGYIELVGGTVADQDLIASARQDLPRLLREVRALRARLQALLADAVDDPTPLLSSSKSSDQSTFDRRL
jgi:hypothetical protein